MLTWPTPRLSTTFDQVIEAARGAGAAALVCIGESQAATTGALRLAARYPRFVFATAGVHPGEAGTYDRQRDELWIRDAVAAGAVAIGECGLDYHYDHVEPRLPARLRLPIRSGWRRPSVDR